MDITWKLYEAEGVDAGNPLGTISVTADDGAVISQEAVYLDSWFEALLAGLRGMVAGDEESLQLVEEPDPLEFRLEDELLVLTQDVFAVRLNLREAIDEIRTEAIDFLRRMQQVPGWDRNATLLNVQKLLAR
jgi:hypothetical protein